eukprot:EG_transcript_50587
MAFVPASGFPMNVPVVPTSSNSSARSLKRKFNQTKMSHFMEQGFQDWQQEQAVQRLTHWRTHCGVPLAALDNSMFRRFLRTLRKDFKAPSRQTLVRRQEALQKDLEERVKEHLRGVDV